MKQVIIFLVLTFSSFFVILISSSFAQIDLVETNSSNLPDTIYWRPDIKLHWVDFRGKEEPESPYIAYTSTIISLQYSLIIKKDFVMPKFKVTCAFNCTNSWARKDKPDLLTNALLEHEQLHFDIAELTARKLRKALEDQKFTKENYQFKIDAIRQNTIDEGDALQERYDNETAHGINLKEQLIWNKKIGIELRKTETWQ